ncbi:cytidine deaminase [Lentiprolixibacter aurantiacus]|uniref:Cytidine deaminase n=1 Tax=Lentiprolixibacter aurantiacus TaxID=2993939 RepID=A0AAE3SQT6_9FLAO|nr:cytidine deaminase [Lentiprolixibacter aurantiacus]MCX2720737.1 cytidine deaminase [Lentiprolixibacter aurantiacus]
MEKKSIVSEINIYHDVGELSPEEQLLLKRASEAREDAYAPYSRFKVGAAVQLENGAIIIGSNQENASFPSGLCAERVAIFQAGASNPGVTVKSIAIVAAPEKSDSGKPAAPCGNCRQAIYEYESKQQKPISILMMGSDGRVFKCRSIETLLPLAFNNDFLG